jgi:hypothetical protein
MNTKFTKNFSLLVLASIVGTNITFAAGNYNYRQNTVPAQPQYQSNYYPESVQSQGAAQTLKGRVVTVPAGVQISAVTSMPISSEYLTMGQSVSLTLGSDFYYNSTLIAPAGSNVLGTVTQVTKAKHGSMNGSLRLRFTEVTTPYGTRIPISAIIKTEDGTGLLKGGTKTDVAKAYAKDMGIGAGAGALTGLVASAISGGAVGKGTAIMTGVGAGAGLVKSIYDKGNDVVIPSNSTVELIIDQPITVNPSGYNYDY